MKNVILASCLALVTIGCGSQANDSHTSSLGSAATLPQTARILKPLDVKLESVKMGAARGPALGLWTDIVVGFDVRCFETLENFSITYNRLPDGKIEVLASAFASSDANTGLMRCQAMTHHQEKITLPGLVAASDVTLVNLAAASQAIPDDTAHIAPIEDITILGTRPSCPQGAKCVINGTIATLEINLSSCVNTLGPVAYRFVQTDAESQKVRLTVKALDFVGKSAPLVLCPETKVQKDVTLPMIIANKDAIALQVLK